MSNKLLASLGFDGDDVEVVIIRRAPKGTTNGSIKGTTNGSIKPEILPIYEDKEGSMPGESTAKEREIESIVLRSKLESLKKTNIEARAKEFIPLDNIDKFLHDVETSVGLRYHKRKRSDEEPEFHKRQRKEDYIKEPGEITPTADGFCGLCRVHGHSVWYCYNVCRKPECKNNVHFKDNCPLAKPCTICRSYSHDGYHCNLRCRAPNCRHFRKYHSCNKCGHYNR